MGATLLWLNGIQDILKEKVQETLYFGSAIQSARGSVLVYMFLDIVLSHTRKECLVAARLAQML